MYMLAQVQLVVTVICRVGLTAFYIRYILIIYHSCRIMSSQYADRYDGVSRSYTQADVVKMRGTVLIEHTLAKMGAERLWGLMNSEPYVHALGALSGAQAVQQVAGGECSLRRKLAS